ncbi:MAG: hypothetical protein B0W54_10420 [Cellvibrio sp. 79]|nr:MAG: hypothetical protein B0W54_10420 [Cellvibrio sp. 79]
MKLIELTINNFMPYKGEQKILFPQHETQNLMLLFGDNMRGKTSFLNSIRWALYGKALARHLREIDRVNLVNIESASEGIWEMSVTLIFSHNEKKYELRRKIEKKRHVSQPRTDSDFEENIGLVVDGERIAGDRIYNEINQVSPEEISRFFLFDGELLQEYENLLIDSSGQGEKIKEHIEQALGVPALIHGRDDLSALLKDARRIQARDAKNDEDSKNYAEQLRQLEIKQSKLERDLEDLGSQRAAIQQEIDSIDDELKNTEIVQNKKIELEKLRTELKQTEISINELVDENRELLKNAWMDVLYETAEPLLQKLREKRDRIHSAVSKKAILEKQLKDIQKTIDNSVCTHCEQVLPDSKLQPFRDKAQLLQAEAELMTVNLEDATALTGQIDKLSNIRSAKEGHRILQNLDKKRKLEVQLIRVETRLEEIEEEIRDFDTNEIMRQREKRDRKATQLTNLIRDIDDRHKELSKTKEQQEHYSILISKTAGAQGRQSTVRVNIYQELEQVFANGIDNLRDALRQDVAENASKAFSELTTEKTYAGLEINSNYGLSILDQNRRVIKERSAGAEQIVALSLIDGLNKTARKIGPIIMDTPLGRLDPKHRSNVLKYLPKMADQVILLVHEGEINPERDISHFAERIGVRYKIQRKSATESIIERCD